MARVMIESAGLGDAVERARWLADYSDGALLHQLTARHDEPVDVASHRRAIRRLLLDRRSFDPTMARTSLGASDMVKSSSSPDPS